MALLALLPLLLLAALAVLCQGNQTNTTSPTLGTATQPGMRTVPLQETPESQGKFGSSKLPAGSLEDEGDNQENILSQLLGDYDKVKAISEGSDCQCKCVVKPLNREACQRIEKGTSQPEDSYTVETITSGPHCKCACIAPPSALNPCEGDFRLKKLRETESSGFKLSAIIEMLEGAFHDLDLLKLHAVTTKIMGRVETLEQIVNKNITKNQEQLKGNVDEIWSELKKKDEQNCTNSHSGNMPDIRRILQRDAAAAYTNTEETFDKRFLRDDTFPEDPKAVSQMKAVSQLKKHTPLQQQILLRSKSASKPAIIRGITYYKAKFTEDESDIEEQQDELFSGDGEIDFLIDDQLQKHEDLLAKTNEEHLPTRGPPTLNAMEEIDHTTIQSAVMRSETDTNNRAAFPTYSPSTSTESAAVRTTVLDSFQNQASTTHTETSYSLATNNHIIMAPETFTTSELTTIALTTTVTEKLSTPTMTTQSPTTADVKTTTSKAPPNMVRKAHSTKGQAVAKQGHDPSKNDEEDDIQKVIGRCKDTLSTISGPTTLNTYGRNEGAWMKDPLAKDDKIYVTNYYYGNTLVEFRNIENFKQGRWSNSYKLPYSWIGTGHVVYNGAFFYNQAFTRNIIKYNLKQRYVSSWSMLHDVVYEEATSWRWRGHSDIDFAVDENGLWVIYPAFDDEGFQQDLIVLSKLNPIDLTTKKETTWRTGLRKDVYGNCFIICGVLYAVDSYNKRNANISYAFDTHTNTQTIPRLVFENEYSYTTQIDYNPKDRLLYAWDNGHQVTYNVIFAY